MAKSNTMLLNGEITRNGKTTKYCVGTGNLGADLEVKQVNTKNGEMTLATGSMAFDFVDGVPRPDGDPLWLRVQAWGKTAEFMAPDGVKGASFVISARLEDRTFTTKEGKEYTNSAAIIERFTFVPKEQRDETVERKVETLAPEGFSEVTSEVDDDEDIPF